MPGLNMNAWGWVCLAVLGGLDGGSLHTVSWIGKILLYTETKTELHGNLNQDGGCSLHREKLKVTGAPMSQHLPESKDSALWVWGTGQRHWEYISECDLCPLWAPSTHWALTGGNTEQGTSMNRSKWLTCSGYSLCPWKMEGVLLTLWGQCEG